MRDKCMHAYMHRKVAFEVSRKCWKTWWLEQHRNASSNPSFVTLSLVIPLSILCGLSSHYPFIICYSLVKQNQNYLLFRIVSALAIHVWNVLNTARRTTRPYSKTL